MPSLDSKELKQERPIEEVSEKDSNLLWMLELFHYLDVHPWSIELAVTIPGGGATASSPAS